MAARVDVVAGGHDLAVFELEPLDAIAVAVDADDLRLLEHLAPEGRGVVEEDLVVDRPVDLEGGPLARPLESRGTRLVVERASRNELEVPKLLPLAPAVGRAELDGEVRRLDLVPAADLVEDARDGGELALAHVVAGEPFAFEDHDAQAVAVLAQVRAQGTARRAAADDGHVALHPLDYGGNSFRNHRAERVQQTIMEVDSTMITPLLAAALVQAPLTGDALLDELQHRAVRFFWEQSNPKNGFTKDRAANDPAKAAPNNVASSASVGFALVALPIGVERRWLPRDEALARTRTTLAHVLADWPQSHGWLYHFVDYDTGARQWNCEASTIDTSILLAGVLAAERYWKDPQVTRDARAFTRRIDWNWALTDGGAKPDSALISMGWTPEKGFIAARWGLKDLDECKMLYVQAYGLSGIRTDGWDRIARTIVRYDGIDMITGGPLFMHQMSESFYSFRGMRDRRGYSYAVESRNAARGNRAYCVDNPKGMKAYGPDFWGLSACDYPGGYSAFGAPGWIEDGGTITPTSAVAAVQWIPKESTAFAEAMRRDHPEAWGRYGFPNGYDPSANDWVGPDVIGIDLGMMLLGVENHRTGLPMRLSASNPAIREGMRRAGLRPAKDADDGPLQRTP